jgi:hypothetical protein
MNIETTLAIHAYGTSEGVKKEWDSRGRGKGQQPPKYKCEKCGGARDAEEVKRRGGTTCPDCDHALKHRFDQVNQENEYERDRLRAACHGANCGRKGKKAGAKPLRAYMTKQESDSLNSKALKVKTRKKARKRY